MRKLGEREGGAGNLYCNALHFHTNCNAMQLCISTRLYCNTTCTAMHLCIFTQIVLHCSAFLQIVLQCKALKIVLECTANATLYTCFAIY